VRKTQFPRLVIPLAVAVLWWLGRVRVGVGEGPDGVRELWAGTAHIPTRFVGRTDVVRDEGKRMALGPQLDPAAHVLHRPWVAAAVRLEILDPDEGRFYRCSLRVTGGGRELEVRGYVGIPLLGRTQTWKRKE